MHDRPAVSDCAQGDVIPLFLPVGGFRMLFTGVTGHAKELVTVVFDATGYVAFRLSRSRAVCKEY